MNPTDKASVLLEALPYLQEFRGKTFLLKIGGSAMDDPGLVDRLMRDIVLMETVGINPVIVHGGGKAISRAMQKTGREANFVGGLRVTDVSTIQVVEQTLSREVNPFLVEQIIAHGGKSIGISGREVFLGKKMTENGVDLGFVGEVIKVNLQRVLPFVAFETIPVITPLASQDGSDLPLNVNADHAASALAKELRVAKLVYVSDVRGVLLEQEDEGSLISSIRRGEIEGMIDDGIVKSGMIPKLRSAGEAIDAGVGKVHLVDGRIAHSLLLEIFTKGGVGTEIVP